MRGLTADRISLTLFLAWLIWLPLPFGSNIEGAQRPLIAIPLLLCASTILLRLYRNGSSRPPARAWWIWTVGASLFVVAAAVQLIPLSPSLLRTVSPESYAVWTESVRVAVFQGVAPAGSMHPVTVNPSATLRELFRLVALLATFQAASMLIHNDTRRTAFAGTLTVVALFEALYGVRAAATQNYAIWGWRNTLIYDRVTGTFVNPNHFAHYLAITTPFAFFLAARAWHASLPGASVGHRVAALVERNLLPFSLGILAALGSLAGILLAQSRGALLALISGGIFVGVVLMLSSPQA
ncbi:MAG: hypothetical protein ABI837_08950, partial [Acidobacteriota bacterium]